MLRDAFLAFDEVVEGSVGYACSDFHVDRLGRFDRLGVFVVVDDLVASASAGNDVTISVELEHSPDAVHWLPKYVDHDGGSSDVAVWDYTGTPLRAAWGGDDGHLPAARYVRFWVRPHATGTASFTKARVRVYASLRDSGKNPKGARGGSARAGQ